MAWCCMIIMICMNQLWIMSIRHSKLDQFGCFKCDAKSRHLCNPSWTRPCAGTPDMSSASRAVKEQDGKTLLGWSSRNSRKHGNLMLLQVTSQAASICPYFSMTCFHIFPPQCVGKRPSKRASTCSPVRRFAHARWGHASLKCRAEAKICSRRVMLCVANGLWESHRNPIETPRNPIGSHRNPIGSQSP